MMVLINQPIIKYIIYYSLYLLYQYNFVKKIYIIHTCHSCCNFFIFDGIVDWCLERELDVDAILVLIESNIIFGVSIFSNGFGDYNININY